MPPKKSRIQLTGENSSIDDMSLEPGNQDLIAAQIVQLVTAAVEQVLAHRSEVNPPPDPQLEEIRKFEEENSRLREERSSLPPPEWTVPFSTEVLVVELPQHFKFQCGRVRRDKGPEEHLSRLKKCHLLHQHSDPIKCQSLPDHLGQISTTVFNLLPAGSIRSFQNFNQTFLLQFASSKNQPWTMLNLFNQKVLAYKQRKMSMYVILYHRVFSTPIRMEIHHFSDQCEENGTVPKKETPVATTVDYSANVDTSHPISSVKDAVALFGKQSLVSPKTFTPSPHPMVKESPLKLSSPIGPGVSSYSSTKLEETVNKLKIELEETKVELKLLKEREIVTEVGLASMKAELHKNKSKLARADAAVASADSSRLMMSIRGEGDRGNIPRVEEKKRERDVTAESDHTDTWLTLAQTSSDGERKEDAGSFLGRKKERKMTKRKPIVPLIGDLLFRKKGSSSTLQSTSYASAYLYWD
ncbi:hypothetical protein F511_02760 [Dorcoceras hygrometricum]|uniref:Uncharacterized protein n=1 Tax=Dorcoceras hygrometricum TaxID=472368 RepID=A0A2Z7DDV2_9LAMI|nr:hypothetical protein F511_02760 [Dorcoceras hygrometricum]